MLLTEIRWGDSNWKCKDYLDVDKYFIVGADIKYDLSLLQGHYGDNEGDAAMIQDGIDAYKKENKE